MNRSLYHIDERNVYRRRDVRIGQMVDVGVEKQQGIGLQCSRADPHSTGCTVTALAQPTTPCDFRLLGI